MEEMGRMRQRRQVETNNSRVDAATSQAINLRPYQL